MECMYPKIEVSHNSGVDDRTIELIDNYWSIKDGKFRFKIKDISYWSLLTQPQITKIVTGSSKAIIVLERCSKCKNEIKYDLEHRSHGFELLNDELARLLCATCQIEYRNSYYKVDDAGKVDFRLKYFYDVTIWTKLATNEVEFLKSYLKASSYKKIIRNLSGPDFESVWKMIEKLERYGILCFKRDINNKLLDIVYYPNLRNVLIGDSYERENELSIKLFPKDNRSLDLQPHYTKKVRLGNEVILKAGVDYMCSMWHNEDGSVLFKITPLTGLQKSDSRGGEAVLAGDLIKKVIG